MLTSLSIAAVGQNKEQLARVTLFSALPSHDHTRTSINFETGERGVLREPIEYYDLSYGFLRVNTDGDWFGVRDPRSRIVDLGVRKWDEIKDTPPFPQPKTKVPPSLTPPKVIDAAAGSTDVSPLRQFVRAQSGHMYLMRVLRGTRVFYVMLRVENVEAEQSCEITWKRVKPPNVTDES